MDIQIYPASGDEMPNVELYKAEGNLLPDVSAEMPDEIIFIPKIERMKSLVSAYFSNEIQLKKVPKEPKFTVFGYCHEADLELNKQSIIPDLIMCTVLAFYVDIEYFEVAGASCKLSHGNRRITKEVISRDNTSIGRITIPSKSDIICRWNIKMIHITYWYGFIGITSDHETKDKNFSRNLKTSNYGYFLHDGRLQIRDDKYRPIYGEQIGVGDILTMELNMKDRTISFAKNDKWFGVAFGKGSDIDKATEKPIDVGNDISYRLAVCLYASNCELLDFTILSGVFEPLKIIQ